MVGKEPVNPKTLLWGPQDLETEASSKGRDRGLLRRVLAKN